MLAVGLPAFAQTKADEFGLPPEEPEKPKASDKELKTKDSDIAPTTPVLTTKKAKRVEAKETWKDIVVIPRKPFIKRGRFELIPFWGVTLNDNIIQHWSIGGELNYHITDVLSIGLLGMYYFPNILDQEFFTRYHYRRVPSINKYEYTVTLNFFYVPFYGKLSLFNDYILHFEIFATAGFGGTGTEIVPKDYRFGVFKNPFSFTFPVGLGARVFINRWLAFYTGGRAYLMVDKFEPPRPAGESGLTPEQEVEAAKENAKTRFIANLQFFMGLSFYFPMDFKYTTFR
jgi:outer membrane beta-barrel protein